jgi:hypothetical protein
VATPPFLFRSGLGTAAMLGPRGVRALAEGLGKPDAARPTRGASSFWELSRAVVSEMGRKGLASLPTPPSFGLVPGIRFQPPPGNLSRSTRSAARSLSERTAHWGKEIDRFRSKGGKEGTELDASTRTLDMDELPGKWKTVSRAPLPPSDPRLAPLGKKMPEASGPELGKPIPALDGKGGDLAKMGDPLGGRLHSVGRMLGHVEELTSALERAIRQSATMLRG